MDVVEEVEEVAAQLEAGAPRALAREVILAFESLGLLEPGSADVASPDRGCSATFDEELLGPDHGRVHVVVPPEQMTERLADLVLGTSLDKVDISG